MLLTTINNIQTHIHVVYMRQRDSQTRTPTARTAVRKNNQTIIDIDEVSEHAPVLVWGRGGLSVCTTLN
jgi:hypothetical protein